MPKVNNTHKERRELLYERLTPEYLFNTTSVFSQLPKGFPQLDAETLNHVRNNYKRYFESWVKDEAKKFILNDKTIL